MTFAALSKGLCARHGGQLPVCGSPADITAAPRAMGIAAMMR